MQVFINNWPLFVMIGVGILSLGLIAGSWWMLRDDEGDEAILSDLADIKERLEDVMQAIEKRSGDARSSN